MHLRFCVMRVAMRQTLQHLTIFDCPFQDSPGISWKSQNYVCFVQVWNRTDSCTVARGEIADSFSQKTSGLLGPLGSSSGGAKKPQKTMRSQGSHDL